MVKNINGGRELAYQKESFSITIHGKPQRLPDKWMNLPSVCKNLRQIDRLPTREQKRKWFDKQLTLVGSWTPVPNVLDSLESVKRGSNPTNH